MRYHQWEQCEIELLTNILHKTSIADIVRQLQKYQERNNLYIRSYQVVTKKIQQLGRKNNLQEDYLNKSQLAKLLKIKLPRVQFWCQKGLKFTPGKTPSSCTTIKLADFAVWAKSNLKLLHGIDRDLLAYATKDQDLADRAAALRPYYCPVVNITTGKTYPGITAAANAHFISGAALSTALKQGRSCCGFEWRFEVAA